MSESGDSRDRHRERVEIQYRSRRGRWHHLKRDRTDRRTTTRYRRGRSYRVRWRAPHGTRYPARTRPIRWP